MGREGSSEPRRGLRQGSLGTVPLLPAHPALHECSLRHSASRSPIQSSDTRWV